MSISRLLNPPKTMAYMSFGVMIIAMTVGSLAQELGRISPVASVDRASQTAIGTTSATSSAPSIDNAEANRPWAEASCNDFNYSFFNSACSKIRKKNAVRTHHVATFVVGHPGASSSSATAQIASATVSAQGETGSRSTSIPSTKRNLRSEN
jgi:hypothetical protein